MRFTETRSGLTAAGPILFGGAFLAPLIAQSLEAAALSAPFGLERITFGLVIGLTLGGVASLRGRWI